tara:strand:- start:192 stop:911 length:720 start_codon:yes stop_codon:yes gene_type:complete
MTNVSILLPVYMRQNFVPFIIRNVKNQDYPQRLLELVIDDDGPEPFIKPSDLEQFREIMAPVTVKYLQYDTRRSIGLKRNNLVKQASNHIVAMMDSDDIYQSTYISHALDLMKTEKKGCVGSPDLILLYEPFTNNDFYIIQCGSHQKHLIHECSMVFTKKWWRASPKFSQTSRGEGLHIFLNNTKQVTCSDISKSMIQICHGENTIDKSQFKMETHKLNNINIGEDMTNFIKDTINRKI